MNSIYGFLVGSKVICDLECRLFISGKIVTPPIIAKNLPDVFKSLPVFGSPKNSAELEEFQNAKVREFVGCALTDEEFGALADFCRYFFLNVSKVNQCSDVCDVSDQ